MLASTSPFAMPSMMRRLFRYSSRGMLLREQIVVDRRGHRHADLDVVLLELLQGFQAVGLALHHQHVAQADVGLGERPASSAACRRRRCRRAPGKYRSAWRRSSCETPAPGRRASRYPPSTPRRACRPAWRSAGRSRRRIRAASRSAANRASRRDRHMRSARPWPWRAPAYP